MLALVDISRVALIIFDSVCQVRGQLIRITFYLTVTV